MIYFLLPAYNEERDLPRLFDEFLRISFPFPYRILVVNDGSTDKTRDRIEPYRARLPIDVLDHGTNLGLGKALRTGFTELEKRIKPGDSVVTMDSDGTHPLDSVFGIKEKIEGGKDVVIASRFAPGGSETGLNVFRRLLSHTASAGLRFLWPIKGIRDYSSGYRGYSYDIVTKLFQAFGSRTIEEGGFSATLELLLKASLLSDGFDEVPLKLRYDRKVGTSKMRVAKTVFRYFTLIIRLKCDVPASSK